MDKLTRYREIVRKLIEEYATQTPSHGQIDSYPVIDRERDHYLAVQAGWGVDPAFQQGLLSNLVGWQKDVPQGGVVWVFAVAK